MDHDGEAQLEMAQVHRTWLVVLIDEQQARTQRLGASGADTSLAHELLDVLQDDLDQIDLFIQRLMLRRGRA